MAMMTKIYALCEPDGEIRYIGKTKHPLAKRMIQHLSDARCGRKTHLYNWLRSVLSTGHLPLIQLIGEVAGNGSNEERAWIKYGRAEGWRLVNGTDGGEGVSGCIFSEERRRKMSKDTLARFAAKGHPRLGCHHSKEAKLKMSLAKKDKPSHRINFHHSKKTCRKMSESRKGRIPWNKDVPCSEEVKHKISLSKKGKPNGCLGHHRSEETKRKLSKAAKIQFATKGHPSLGRHPTEETRRRLSEATKKQCSEKGHPMQGRHHSEISKLKMRESKASLESKFKMCESQKIRRMREENSYIQGKIGL